MMHTRKTVDKQDQEGPEHTKCVCCLFYEMKRLERIFQWLWLMGWFGTGKLPEEMSGATYGAIASQPKMNG